MALIKQCDICDLLSSAGNPVEFLDCEYKYSSGRDSGYFDIKGPGGIVISIPIPNEARNKLVCDTCKRAMISAKFADVCGMIAPYQPPRTAGLIQSGESLTKEDRQILSSLQRLLPSS